MYKYCSNCGKKLTEDEYICSNCGMNIKQNNQLIDKTDKNALIGFILGLVSIIAWIIPLFGYPVGICGLVFSTKGMNSNENKSKAVAGLILSIVFLSFTLINSILGIFINLYNNYYF